MQQTHYEILGVATTAAPEAIKKRFRELARQHHPDVNPDKTASHQAFVRITEAYQVLSDPGRRAAYDLTLRDRARRLEAGRPSTAAPGARPGPNPPPPHVGSRQGQGGRGAGGQGSRGAGERGSRDWETAGAGRPDAGAGVGSPFGPTARAARSAATRARGQQRPLDAAQYLRRAQSAYGGLRYRDAIRDCEAALRLDPRSALASSLLGDIYRAQGKIEDAIRYYSMAVQFSPPHQAQAMMSRLEALLARERTARPRAAAADPAVAAHAVRRRAHQRAAVGAFGLALSLGLMFILAQGTGEPLAGLAWISGWTAPMLWAMGLGGALVGATLALSGALRPLDEELFLASLARPHAGRPPMGLVLAVSGAIFFYLAVGIYFLVAALQESVSRSLLHVFVATFVIVCCLAAIVPAEAGRQILLLGGNVVFISMLCGWMLGDFFRPIGS